jgi:hypothetical protein
VGGLALAAVVSTSFVGGASAVRASAEAPLGSCAPTLLTQDAFDPLRLFRIDPSTGIASLEATWTGSGPIDLLRADYDVDGTLYAIRSEPGQRQPKWTAVDYERGTVTFVSPLPQDLQVIDFAFTASANASTKGYLLEGSRLLNAPLRLFAINSAWPLVLTPVATTFPTLHNRSLGLGVSPDGTLYWTTQDAVFTAAAPSFEWLPIAFLKPLNLVSSAEVAGPSAGEAQRIFIQSQNVLFTTDVVTEHTDVMSITGMPWGARGLLLRECPVGGVRLVPQSGLTTTEAGGSAQFTAVLTTPPQAPVTVHFKTTNPAEGRIRGRPLVFDDSNWFVPQTVTVAGVPDGVPDGSQAYWITGFPMESDDPAYDAREVGRIPAVNVDVDTVRPSGGEPSSLRPVR